MTALSPTALAMRLRRSQDTSRGDLGQSADRPALAGQGPDPPGPYQSRRPGRAPSSGSGGYSALVCGRHKVTSLCLSGSRQRPVASPSTQRAAMHVARWLSWRSNGVGNTALPLVVDVTPPPDRPWVSQRSAGGDQGGADGDGAAAWPVSPEPAEGL